MKTITKMKGLILLLMAVVLQSSAFAQEVITSTFTDQNLATKEGVKWTGEAPGFDSQNNPSKGLQFYGKNKHFTLTYANAKDVQSIELHYASTTKGIGTIEAKVGEQVIGEKVSVNKDATNGKTHTFTSSSNLSGDVTLNLTITANSLYISKVVITTASGGTIATPTFSKEAGYFFDPFDLTITAGEGCNIKYTLDNSDPSKENGTDYTEAINIDKTTTVKAIAIKGDQISEVATATYTLVTLNGNGTFENPYTVDDIEFLDANTKGWFKGTIKGTYKDGKPITTNPDTTNLAIGNNNTLIPIQLPEGNLSLIHI